MKIVILENDDSEFNNTKELISKWAFKYDTTNSISHYKSGEEFCFNADNYDLDADLFILDIKMKKISGIEIARLIRSKGFDKYIIFLSSFHEFLLDGYDVHAFNYLIKPINKSLLFKCLTEIENTLCEKKYIYKNRYDTFAIPYKDIISFSVNRHHLEIATSKNIFTQYNNLNSVIHKLPKYFIRVHRSCIVNMEHIIKINHNKIYLSNKTTIHIGPTYLDEFQRKYFLYITRFNRSDNQ